MDIDKLYREESRHLLNWLMKQGIGYDGANDLVHNIFLYMLEHPQNFNPKQGSLKGWMWFLARAWRKKAFMEELAASQRTDVYDMDIQVPSLQDVERDVYAKEMLEIAGDKISQIKGKLKRRILRLKFSSEDSSEEIAKICGVTKSYVNTIIRDFRKNF